MERMGYMWVYLSVKGREVVAAIGCFARIKSMLTERIMLARPKKAELSTDIGFVETA